MIIDRNEYVEQLLTKCWNGKVMTAGDNSENTFNQPLSYFQSGSLYHDLGNPIAATSTIEYSDRSTFNFCLKLLLG